MQKTRVITHPHILIGDPDVQVPLPLVPWGDVRPPAEGGHSHCAAHRQDGQAVGEAAVRPRLRGDTATSAHASRAPPHRALSFQGRAATSGPPTSSPARAPSGSQAGLCTPTTGPFHNNCTEPDRASTFKALTQWLSVRSPVVTDDSTCTGARCHEAGTHPVLSAGASLTSDTEQTVQNHWKASHFQHAAQGTGPNYHRAWGRYIKALFTRQRVFWTWPGGEGRTEQGREASRGRRGSVHP